MLVQYLFSASRSTSAVISKGRGSYASLGGSLLSRLPLVIVSNGEFITVPEIWLFSVRRKRMASIQNWLDTLLLWRPWGSPTERVDYVVLNSRMDSAK